MTIRRTPLVLTFFVFLACGSNTVTGPTTADLSGRWTGTSTYPNAPFQLQLTQTAGTLRGTYADTYDRSLSVGGTLDGSAMRVVIDFGDAKLNIDGTVIDARTILGDMYTSALGNRRYPYTMRR